MTLQLIALAAFAFVCLAVKYFNRTDIPKIKGLPEIPGVPIFGNLIQLWNSHAKVAQNWSKKYGPVFQVRLGNRRIVFVNDFESVKHIWITNQWALISRPPLYTFGNAVSSSEGYTIGTAPWDDSCKRRRKAVATALNRPAVESYMPIIDLEANVSIKEMLLDSQYGRVDVNPIPYFQRFALNTSLTLNYGNRINGDKDNDLLKEIVHVERTVSNLRSTSGNWQDYIPLLRLWPSKNNEAAQYRARRDVYLTRLLNMLKDQIANGTDKPCITGNVLKDPEAKLSETEIKSIGLTMVSAGLDTVPSHLIMLIALLSAPSYSHIQKNAYHAIQSAYPDNDAWERCLHEEKIPYISALVKEVLRYWTVIPICLPRSSIKPIVWNGATIPAGTTFYMNAYAADYDEAHFKDPHTFVPERFMGQAEGQGTQHYAYGAGSRICGGVHLANREMYVAFVRLIIAFEFRPSLRAEDRPVLDALGAHAIPNGLTMEPKLFKVGLKVRDKEALDRWMAGSEERTRELMG